MTPDAIVVEDLAKRYANGTHAVRGVTFRVGPGEIVGLVGPNGAGKSTTLNILATLVAPSGGDARIFGVSVRDRAAVRPLLGVALQSTGLDPLMTVADHFDVHAALYRMRSKDARARTGELVDAFRLGEYRGRKAGELSGGTQRRLALALALLHGPRAIVFDEPTVGLDPSSRRDVWELLEDLRSQGLAILFSTHYMDEADRLCQRIELVSEGRIVASGTPDELKARAERGVVRLRVVGGSDVAERALDAAAARRLLPPRDRFTVQDGVIQVQTEPSDPSFLPLLSLMLEEVGGDIVDLNWGHGRLDDVFTQLAASSASVGVVPAVTMEHRAHARRGRRR